MEHAASSAADLVSNSHQSALAMAVMHGARRQLQLTLSRFCPRLTVTVSTIHSFALRIVNRWRRSLGLPAPVTICELSCGLIESNGLTQATFDEVMLMACSLLESPTVCNTLAESHPLVIVDEFQDCVGSTLQFVQALGNSAKLLLAADHFQLLQADDTGCPAVDWASRLRQEGSIDYEELVGCNRTNVSAILRAARALRDNKKEVQCTVPVYFGYQPGQVAYRMVERFTGWGGASLISDGTCALIALSLDDRQLHKLLKSFEEQLARKTARQVNWSLGLSEAQLQTELFDELRIGATGAAGSPRSGATRAGNDGPPAAPPPPIAPRVGRSPGRARDRHVLAPGMVRVVVVQASRLRVERTNSVQPGRSHRKSALAAASHAKHPTVEQAGQGLAVVDFASVNHREGLFPRTQ